MTVETVRIPGYVTGVWVIDPTHSEVGFTVRHLMISKVRGAFRAFEGRVVTAEDPLASSVTASIDLASVDTGNAQRDEHVRSADFLEVEKYPFMTYRSTGLRPDGDAFVLDGELTLKGVTRPVPLALELNGIGPDVFRPDVPTGARVGFTATGEIDRRDFGISFNSPIPGGVMLSERIEITLDIQAALQTD
ncbi:YceI family protein [Thermomonospora umbrina]|uniref:Polyisoprenoid-binding protein YceI n=1 Tax=Thermomonospora umbrina TaxID=111806 RepID=A0A3D9SVG2_9ACTN|nr:YceI family protein [Thermomonospora umbrina]REE96564.1 polyisoprenoid-binding protein YceI [Thermomonospora umbrina]